MLGPDPAKVRCRTCHSDHDYRHEQPPPPKIDPRKAAVAAESAIAAESADPVPADPVPTDSVNVVIEEGPAKSKRAKK